MNFNEKVWQKGIQKLIEEKDELEKQNRELQARNTELVQKNRELQKELPVNQYGFQSEDGFQPGEIVEFSRTVMLAYPTNGENRRVVEGSSAIIHQNHEPGYFELFFLHGQNKPSLTPYIAHKNSLRKVRKKEN